MVGEAEKFAEEDKKQRDLIDTKNQADSIVYQTEKQMSEFKDKLPEDVKTKIEEQIKSLKAAIEKEDVTEMKAKMEELKEQVMQMGASMYSKDGQNPPPSGDPNPTDTASASSEDTTSTTSKKKDDDDDNVVDAEFKDAN